MEIWHLPVSLGSARASCSTAFLISLPANIAQTASPFRKAAMATLYVILGIDKDATQQEIKQAYKKA